jgi:hypothetical protein
MLSDTALHVDDLSPDEAASVLRVYEDGLGGDDHESAFERAVDVLRSIRPQLPPNIAGSELELLLATSVPATANAPYAFCE